MGRTKSEPKKTLRPCSCGCGLKVSRWTALRHRQGKAGPRVKALHENAVSQGASLRPAAPLRIQQRSHSIVRCTSPDLDFDQPPYSPPAVSDALAMQLDPAGLGHGSPPYSPLQPELGDLPDPLLALEHAPAVVGSSESDADESLYEKSEADVDESILGGPDQDVDEIDTDLSKGVPLEDWINEDFERDFAELGMFLEFTSWERYP
jgi:hypothetical protein